MRSLALALTAAVTAGSANATVLVFEDFEDASVAYTTNPAEFTDGTGDFFIRTDGSDHGSFYTPAGFNGNSYFAVMDIDGDQPVEPVTMSFSGINITGYTGFKLSGLFGEDDDASNEDWDDNDYVHITYSVDAGPAQNLLWFENDGSQFNSAPYIDTDFDGTGDGLELTNIAQLIEATASVSGSTLDITFEFQLEAGDEDIFFDDVTITGIPEPASAALLGLGAALAGRRRRA